MTNILILSLQLLFQTPTNDFTGYYGGITNTPSWYATSNMCWTAVIEFNGPPGTYETWWDSDFVPAVPFPDGNGWIGANPIHINGWITKTNDAPMIVVMPIIPELS